MQTLKETKQSAATDPQRPWVILHSRHEPYPLDSGANQRIWALSSFLRQYYRVGLVIHQGIPRHHQALGKAFDRVWSLNLLDFSLLSLGRRYWQIWTLINKKQCQEFTDLYAPYQDNPMVKVNAALAAFIERLYRKLRPVAVLAEYIWAAVPPLLIAKRLGIKAILDTHDVMSQRIASQRQAGLEPQFELSKEEEIQLLRTADAVVAIQTDEGKLLATMVPDKQVIVAEHPVRVNSSYGNTVEQHTVLFVGSRAQHNLEGISRFIEEQWPQTLALLPQVQLRIVGSVCSLLPEALQQRPNLYCVGVVDDLAAEYARAAVVLNPIRFGSGLKIKSVEALAHGKAMLSTPLGIEGMEAMTNQAFCCVPFEETGQALAQLLADPQRQQKLGAAAAAYAKERFSPEICFTRLLNYLQEKN
jgi:glycosyltransferase involved in cell wall biosynthesis